MGLVCLYSFLHYMTYRGDVPLDLELGFERNQARGLGTGLTVDMWGRFVVVRLLGWSGMVLIQELLLEEAVCKDVGRNLEHARARFNVVLM